MVSKIGKYELLEELGRGGMGVVYKGYDPLIGREVAIKVISESALIVPEIKARFLREARTAGQLAHPNIAVIYELGEMDDKTFIVMEFIPGRDLRKVIDDREKMTVQQKLELARAMCEGLKEAHSKGVVHRDIKPENIRIRDDGQLKVIDFGIAKPHTEKRDDAPLTEAGMRIGTPWYMSPEQVKGATVDQRSDIFSIGVLFYEFLTYRKPFEGDDTTVLYKILHEEPEEFKIDESVLVDDLRDLLNKCLAKDPKDRYQNCGELIDDLNEVLRKSRRERQAMELLAESQALADELRFAEAIKKTQEILRIDPKHKEAKAYLTKLLAREKESATVRILTGRIEGDVVSHYQILSRLGGGGMGVVYKAEDVLLKRTVALKFLLPELTQDEAAKKRFLKEAQAASALEHPNICVIHEINETEDGLMFICMAFCEGKDLRSKMADGNVEIMDAVDIIAQTAAGLAVAHSRGIVHRDIKPLNVIVADDGVVKIVDFGLAKLSGGTRITKTGTTMGTLPYMSPEQIRGEELDHRSDIWSLGVMLYELLTAQLPFSADYEASILYSILNTNAVPVTEINPRVPTELERIVSKALAKNIDDRYQSVEALHGDLEKLKKRLSQERATRIQMDAQVTQLIQGSKTKIESRQYTDAMSDLEAAQQLDPDNEEVQRLINRTAKRRQELAEIERLLRLGKEQFDARDYELSLDTYRRALSIDPDNEEAKALIASIERQVQQRTPHPIAGDEETQEISTYDEPLKKTPAQPPRARTREQATPAGANGSRRRSVYIAAASITVVILGLAGWQGYRAFGPTPAVAVSLVPDADCKLSDANGVVYDLRANEASVLELAPGDYEYEVRPRSYPCFKYTLRVSPDAGATVRESIAIASRFQNTAKIRLTVNGYYGSNDGDKIDKSVIINGYPRTLDGLRNFKSEFRRGRYYVRFDLPDASFASADANTKSVTSPSRYEFDFTQASEERVRIRFIYKQEGS